MLEGVIIKGVGGLYSVDTVKGVYVCQARGLFRNQNQTILVGDFVQIYKIDENKKTAYLEKILVRKNSLIRPKVANIEQGLLVFSLASPALNINLLDRFIILMEAQNEVLKAKTLDIVICFNKVDLVDENVVKEFKEIYGNIGYKTIATSTFTKFGIDELSSVLKDKTTILAGPSGTGKSSLLNTAFPHLNLETGKLSEKIQRGKHTTRHTEFLKLSENGYIADTPGFTSISIDSILKENISLYFVEFKPFIGKCKYNNCKHISEPNCAVIDEIGKSISKKRYESYVAFMQD